LALSSKVFWPAALLLAYGLLASPKQMIEMGPPTEVDLDGDGLTNAAEASYGTSPTDIDTDGDQLPDGFEIWGKLDPLAHDDLTVDPDGDGLSHLEESIYKTLPLKADTDGDGVADGIEVANLSSPIDPNELYGPPRSEIIELRLTVGDHSSSESERYNLVVGPYVHQAPDFGVVNTKSYPFRRGETYMIELFHIGTKPTETTDYDYTAQILGDDASSYEIDDPEGILGTHSDVDFPNLRGKTARLRILQKSTPP